VIALLGGGLQADAQVTHHLSVVTLRGVQTSSQEIASLMTDAALALRMRDQEGDVAALVLFRPAGAVHQISHPSGIYSSSSYSHLARVSPESAFVYFADDMWWCDKQVGPGPVNGCGFPPTATRRPFFVVSVRHRQYLAATFAHEYGHSRGLDHRPRAVPSGACPSTAVPVMYPYTCQKAVLLSMSECRALAQPHSEPHAQTTSAIPNRPCVP
jgi:hypothetical protein